MVLEGWSVILYKELGKWKFVVIDMKCIGYNCDLSYWVYLEKGGLCNLSDVVRGSGECVERVDEIVMVCWFEC